MIQIQINIHLFFFLFFLNSKSSLCFFSVVLVRHRAGFQFPCTAVVCSLHNILTCELNWCSHSGGLALWIPGMDSVFLEESLLILTDMVISFSPVCGMKMCAHNETFFFFFFFQTHSLLTESRKIFNWK